jgi:hypothetical protein
MTTCNWTLPATEQEVFDLVATGLLRQNRKSTDPYGGCSYRGIEGCKCAAGMLIPDQHYKPEFECWGWENLVRRGVVPPECTSLICRLQGIHDNYYTWSWRTELSRLAAHYGLNTAAIDAMKQEPTP